MLLPIGLWLCTCTTQQYNFLYSTHERNMTCFAMIYRNICSKVIIIYDSILRVLYNRCECPPGVSMIGSRCMDSSLIGCGQGSNSQCGAGEQCIHGHCYTLCSDNGCFIDYTCSNGNCSVCMFYFTYCCRLYFRGAFHIAVRLII